MQDIANIPSTPTLREKLAAAMAESRYLRSLLKIARQRDEAVRLQEQANKIKALAEQEGGAHALHR
jgi:hypothetical protein